MSSDQLTPAQAAERIGRNLYVLQAAEQARRAWEAGVTTEARYLAEWGIERSYSRGGVIEGEPIRVTLALDECVVNKRDGQWQCVRTDPEHVAMERHRLFPAALQLHESAVLADLNAAAHHFRRAPREPEPGDGFSIGWELPGPASDLDDPTVQHYHLPAELERPTE